MESILSIREVVRFLHKLICISSPPALFYGEFNNGFCYEGKILPDFAGNNCYLHSVPERGRQLITYHLAKDLTGWFSQI